MWKAIKNLLKKAIEKPEDKEDNNHIDLFHPNYSEHNVSMDEVFATNFNAGGGHFLFCDNNQEAFQNLKEIIHYENVTELICLDPKLQEILTNIQIPYVENPCDSRYTLSFLSCEFLIAFDGSIMLSAHQTCGRNIDDFPSNFIIYARPSQLVENVGAALQKLRTLKKDNLPSKITSIRGKNMHKFPNVQNAKNIYLLLVEE
ncbi:hypothetical protein F0358_08025 [Empedobacter brevis]|uniref:LUD domain-containing protein n=1 Tax=Empedobacter brevis NBRC 14943 = ATCC 43319 TaxID=1218108 RepID=A0A511NIU1_9FLAO|nr:hypothetical protein [Empedobacter brevis]QES92666.1 hypothetical protein F0358_08025 [Empedobacter brevis]QHC84420.1 hypothetical protein AS589_06270 [Empedobacter brevis]GEM52141.1 hypothetical protein EB1_19310 [Empedobacter brevis NBRC 14943 = ATCC 43319]